MRKYLELFTENFPADIADKLVSSNWPYVGYSMTEDRVVHAAIPEPEEPDPTAGYVDLGLSVMWASCDVGASSPEREGTKYTWGEESWDAIPLEFDPVYMNSDMELKWKEALQPRTPSPAQVKELLDNTTATEEVLNGVSGMRYTASNGNSIFVSNVERWTNAFKYLVNLYSILEAVCWNPSSGIIDNTATANSNGAQYTMKTFQYPFRGVCSNLPQGGAILLEYGKAVKLAANDTNTLYCFPRTWTSTTFASSSDFNIQMYSSPSFDFGIASSNGAWRRIFVFDKDVKGRILNISTKEMQMVTNRAIDDYVYVRFVCKASTTIIPNPWETTECADQSTLIRPNASFAVVARSSNTVFRMRYQDWVGYDITIQWGGNVKLPTYIADACSYILSANNSHVLKYANIQPQSSVFIDAATITTWASHVDEAGYLYVRFNPTNQGSVIFKSTKPADVDPEIPDPIYTTVDNTVTDCGCETE